MSDEIDKPIPECGQCNDYFKVQQIKTARIKELQKQLDVAVEALNEITNKTQDWGVGLDMAAIATAALKKIGEGK